MMAFAQKLKKSENSVEKMAIVFQIFNRFFFVLRQNLNFFDFIGNLSDGVSQVQKPIAVKIFFHVNKYFVLEFFITTNKDRDGKQSSFVNY